MVDHHRRSSNRYQEPYPHQNLGRSRKEYPDHLFYIPFQPVHALWGAGLSVAFILLNILADKMRLWSGVPWTIAAGVIIAAMLQGQEPGEGL